MDADAVEAAGAEPLAEPLAGIAALGSVDELVALVGRHTRQGVRGLLDLEAESDPGNPDRYVMFVGQGGLGLPDEEYYRLPAYADIRAAYRTHVAGSLALAGFLTNCCVESTMRSGYERGYQVYTLTDCVAATSQEEHDNAIAKDYPMFSRPVTGAEFTAALAGNSLTDSSRGY